MKSIKLLAAVSVAFGLASSAYAQTKIYIAGAPALRTELTTAIENLLLGQGSVIRAYNGSALITANVIEWRNATIAGQSVIIKLNYNGSAGGWKTNAASQNVRFLPDGLTGPNQVDVLTDTGATAENHIPDFHISNEFQDSTPWIGTNSISFPELGSTTYARLNDLIVGILPLRIVASKGAPNGLNLTPQLAQQLFGNGSLRLSQITGNVADFNKTAYPISRGIDSGIRTLFASGTGFGTSSPALTWQATTSNTTNKPVVGVTVVAPGILYTVPPIITIAAPPVGGTQATATATIANGQITAINITNQGSGYNSVPSVSIARAPGDTTGALASARAVIEGGTVTSQALWPATSGSSRILGVATAIGNGGYPTFGPLLTALTSTLNLPGGNAGDIYITPLGDSDADSAIKAGAKEVTWNGVSLGVLGSYGNVDGEINTPDPNGGTATPTLANGSYDLWGYVRLPYRNNLPVLQRNVLFAIGNQLKNVDAPVLLKDVNIQRLNDGGPILEGQYEE